MDSVYEYWEIKFCGKIMMEVEVLKFTLSNFI